jgi:hypothetical protein
VRHGRRYAGNACGRKIRHATTVGSVLATQGRVIRSRVKILWIGQQPYNEGAGEEVVDRKLKAELRALGHQIDDFYPLPVSRVRELFNLSVRRLPYYRARFESAASVEAVRGISRSYDAAVVSWEPFDRLALESPIPVVLLLHNITSSAIRSVFPHNLLARYLANRSDLWEHRAYESRRLSAIATLSVADQRYVASIAQNTPVLYTPPGMPPVSELSADARFVPELFVSGTYGWFPKRRDVLAFAREYAACAAKLPVVADALPPAAQALVRPYAATLGDTTHSIRLGLITDRFESGHKLKTAYYLANNAIVLSYANVSRDFEPIPDHGFFVRKISTASDIARHAAEVQAIEPAELRARLAAFKLSCQEKFSWRRSASVLAQALGSAVS